MRVLMIHCCAMDSTLLVIQYSTKPAGKKKNMMLKASGMNHISLACMGSGGAGFKAVCSTVVRVITTGTSNESCGSSAVTVDSLEFKRTPPARRFVQMNEYGPMQRSHGRGLSLVYEAWQRLRSRHGPWMNRD